MLENIPVLTRSDIEKLDKMQVTFSYADDEIVFNNHIVETVEGILDELQKILLLRKIDVVRRIEHLRPVAEFATSGDEARPITDFEIVALVRKACIKHLANTLKGRVLGHEVISK